MEPLDFNSSEGLSVVIRMGLAYLLTIPIGWNREASTRSAGLRTFPLVGASACGYMMIGLNSLASDDSQARVMYGIITGIGFIGGGAILKEKGGVSGTATAASIWNTGAIGIAVAFGKLEIASVLAVLNYLTLLLFTPLKAKINHQNDPTDSVESGEDKGRS